MEVVPSNLNPADDATRGLDASKLINQSCWINGPYFLKFEDDLWPVATCALPVIPDEFAVLKKQVFNVNAAKDLKTHESFSERFSRFLTWYKLKRSISWILRLKELLLKRSTSKAPLTVDEIESAENVIIQSVQCDHFYKEIDHLQRNKFIDKNVQTKLNPVVFKGVLCV